MLQCEQSGAAYWLRTAALSVAELRQEIGVYLDARRRDDKALGTINMDNTKISQFLRWLETGALNE